MNKKIVITIMLFIFSFLLLKNGVYLIRENDNLMKMLKEKQKTYNSIPIDAIITKHTMIPGIKGKKINLKKSYNNMKGINEFKESLLVFDEIKPTKTINNIYDKVIISGNPSINKISIITNLDDKYCYTENITIQKDCILNHKYTILIYKISDNYLNNIRQLLKNGIIFYIDNEQDEFNLLIKYIKNNNYEIVPLQELIKE